MLFLSCARFLVFFLSLVQMLPTPSEAFFALEGITLPATQHLNGTVLAFNGAGVRSVHFFGFHFKIYVAGFYTEQPIRSSDHALAASGRPMQLLFTFLRSVGQDKVKEAWKRQLDASVSHHYDGFSDDRDSFIQMFGPIANGGTEMIQFIGEDTVIYDQGQHKGVIAGRNFQRAFLSMWFGERAVAADLKAALLGAPLCSP